MGSKEGWKSQCQVFFFHPRIESSRYYVPVRRTRARHHHLIDYGWMVRREEHSRWIQAAIRSGSPKKEDTTAKVLGTSEACWSGLTMNIPQPRSTRLQPFPVTQSLNRRGLLKTRFRNDSVTWVLAVTYFRRLLWRAPFWYAERLSMKPEHNRVIKEGPRSSKCNEELIASAMRTNVALDHRAIGRGSMFIIHTASLEGPK